MNDTRKAVLAVLKGATAPMTLADISAAVGYDVKTGSINALITAGVIGKGDKVSVKRATSRKVNTYAYGGKDSADKLEMTDTRKAIVDTLKGATAPMTLADISAAVGAKVASGAMNVLTAKGIAVVAGETNVAATKTVAVDTYVLGDTSVIA